MAEPKPLPVVDPESAPFWEACSERRLLIQRCGACGAAVFYPRAICPACHADQLGWEETSGQGEIYSYTISRRPAGPGWSDEVPYAVVLVDLVEGVRMLGALRTDDLDAVRIGMDVTVDFEDRDGVMMPCWRPA